MRRYLIFTADATLTVAIGVLLALVLIHGHEPLVASSDHSSSQVIAKHDDASMWLVELFHDFDFVASSPIQFEYVPRLKRNFILSEQSSARGKETQPFPQKLEAGYRYILRNRSLPADPFYRLLEKRFRALDVKTSIFIPHSVMSVVYDPPIPVRFIGSPPLVSQPMSLVFRGKGYEGLVIIEESEQAAMNLRLNAAADVHEYSLIILKDPRWNRYAQPNKALQLTAR